MRPQDRAWAILDTTVLRFGPAALMLGVSIIAAPSVVGHLAVITMAYTLYQAAIEVPLRLSSQRFLMSPGGQHVMGRLQILGGVLGAMSVLGAVAYVEHRNPGGNAPSQFLALMAIAPISNAVGIGRLSHLQFHGNWKRIAVIRTASVTIAASGAFACLLNQLPYQAVAAQLVGTEIVFAALLLRQPYQHVPTNLLLGDYSIIRDVLATALISVSGWLLSQTERISFAIVGAMSSLGLFTLAFALARAVPDALSAGMANPLVTKLANSEGDEVSNIHLQESVRMQFLMIFASASIVLVALPIVATFLSDHYAKAIAAVPLLAASSVAASFCWSGSLLLNHLGMNSRITLINCLQFALSIATVLVFVIDFHLGAAAYLLRQSVVAAAFALAGHRHIPARASIPWLVATTCLSGVAVLT